MKLRSAGCAVPNQAMLEMEAVPNTEFEPAVLACLPATPWAISAEEVARRRDLRATRRVHPSSC